MGLDARAWIGIASTCAMLFGAARASADPIRILVAASHTRGGEGEEPLRHSTEDADQVRDVLASLGGFGSDAIFRLVEPNAGELLGAIDHARAMASTHPPGEVTFVLYFSGHGDKESLRLGNETVSVSDISARVQSVPAALRVLVTDACRTDSTRPKGIAAEPGFALSDARAPAEGVVWLFASEAGEAAQESDELRGALFTHYWVNGLRGAADANGDGRITLAESYDFAYSQTLFRSARSSGVLQHPTATFELREAAPIVLTQTFGVNTKIEFPQGADTHYLVYAVGSRSVLGEIWSQPDRQVLLAVPAGRYIVQRRTTGGASAAAEVALAAGQARSIVASDFRGIPEEQLAGKGGYLVLRPNELELELGVGASRVTDAMGAARVRYVRSLGGAWAVGAGLRGSMGLQHAAGNDARVTSFGVEATGEFRMPLGNFALGVGLGAAGDVLMQHLRRNDAARAAPGFPTTFDFTAFAPGPVALVRLRERISALVWMEIATRGELLVAELDGTPSALWLVLGEIGAGATF
jgi:hypothetical protein